MAKRFTKIILSLLVLVLIAIWAEIARSPADDAVHLYFFNVGQGDAELIQKGDYQILIDGGPDDSVLAQIGDKMALSDRKIEILILTHPHADHLAGLNQILDRYEVGSIYLSGAVSSSNLYIEFLDKIKQKNIQTIVPDVNQSVDTFADAKLTFLWPGKKYQEQKLDNLNNSSEVVKFCYFTQCTLYTGDIETDEQAQMFAGNTQADYFAQILKIPHHGSINGTNQKLIDKVKPQYTVIEVGADNMYGHPHVVTLDLLQKAGVKTMRTDRDGTVEFVLSQEMITLK